MESNIPANFYVQGQNSNGVLVYIPAKILVDNNGDPVKDPMWGQTYYGNDGIASTPNAAGASNPNYQIYNADGSINSWQNTGGYLIVPADYNVNNQLAAAAKIVSAADGDETGLNALSAFITYFQQGSIGDLQRTYDQGQYGNAFIRAFTDAGAANYGLVSAAVGLTPDEAYRLAGLANRAEAVGSKDIDTSGYLGNSVRNTIGIEAGYKAYNATNPNSTVYNFSDIEKNFETPRPRQASSSEYSNNPSVILTNYGDGTSSLNYINPNSQTKEETNYYTGENATGNLTDTASVDNDGSMAISDEQTAGPIVGIYTEASGSISFVTTQTQNSNGTATFAAGNGVSEIAVSSSTLDGAQVAYNGNGAFTFGSPQADPDGLVNQLTVNGSFALNSLSIFDPTTGGAATIPLADGSSTSVQEGRSVATDAPNEQALTTENNGQVDDSVIGQGATVGSGITNVSLVGAGTTAIVNDTAPVALTASNQGVTLDESGSKVTVASGLENETISGASDTVTAGSADTGTITGSGDMVALSGNSGDSLNVAGINQTVTGDTGTDKVALSGTSTTATIDGGGVVDISGSKDSLTLGNTGSTVDAADSLTGLTIDGSKDTIDFGKNDNGTVNGSGDSIDLSGNSKEFVNLDGSGFQVYTDTGNNAINLEGTGTSAEVRGGGFIGMYGADEYVDATGEASISVGAHLGKIAISASYASIYEGRGDQVDVYGYGDTLHTGGGDSNGGSYYSNGDGGGVYDGDGGGGDGGGGDDGGGDDGGGDSGVSDDFIKHAKALKGSSAAPHSSPLTQAETAAAQANGASTKASGASAGTASTHTSAMTQAELALAHAQGAMNAEAKMGVVTKPVFEGAKWKDAAPAGASSTSATAKPTVTWSFATSPGSAADPFSGYLSSKYQATVEQAVRAWAAASGINFQEVADSSSADIRIGWGNLGTGQSGLIGTTSYNQTKGAMQAGTIIRLEDPSATPLVERSDGQLTYKGTGATLYQVVLHELGHALGLADDSDPSSVMYASSSKQNRTLDATDVKGIQSLYGALGSTPTTAAAASTISAAHASGVNQLIQAMATFAPKQATAPLSTVVASAALAPTLATPAHH